jgi:hypothetical protein
MSSYEVSMNNPLVNLKDKISQIDASSEKMDQANDVLRDLENAILELHRKVHLTIDTHMNPEGTHTISMEYRRGDVQGMKSVWGLFIREMIFDAMRDNSVETSWHWANAPGVMRIKAASRSEDFTKKASEIADNIIAELPKEGLR